MGGKKMDLNTAFVLLLLPDKTIKSSPKINIDAMNLFKSGFLFAE
jgi:hypothetical protein